MLKVHEIKEGKIERWSSVAHQTVFSKSCALIYLVSIVCNLFSKYVWRARCGIAFIIYHYNPLL